MNCPICAWTPEEVDYPFIFETSHWIVKLGPNQSLLGRCVISTQRHVGDLADLTQPEMIDLLAVIKQLEGAVRRAFGAVMFNWSCYMNLAYREEPADPHVHWWMVPRYNSAREIDGIAFADPHFGEPYDHYRWQDVSIELKTHIVGKILAALPRESTE